jgi:integrase/recombinase XerD
LLNGLHSEYLLIGATGKVINLNKVSRIVRKCVKQAKLNKAITTHSLRHTCATHLLKNGASIRLIQELLGHSSLDSTQLYTRVDIRDLKSALDKFHPRGGI